MKDGFELPSMALLARGEKSRASAASAGELEHTATLLQQTLEDFGVPAKVVGWVAGPTVTLFKVDLPSGVRVSRITVLDTDIALALATPSVRIFAPIPGTNYVGIEVPNITRETVYLADVLADAGDGPLQIAIGKDVEGNAIVSDLAKMPHLLIGGTTPEQALYEKVRELTDARIHVLIRPRYGDFLYTEHEFGIILRSVELYRRLGADGVVV